MTELKKEQNFKKHLKKAVLYWLEKTTGKDDVQKKLATIHVRGLLKVIREISDLKNFIFAVPDLKERELRSVIAELVNEGHPILSNKDGYWLSNDPMEIDGQARKLYSAGKKFLDRANSLSQTASRIRRGRR